MKYIGTNQQIDITWEITRGSSGLREDFRRASLFVFLIRDKEQIPLIYTLDENFIKATLPDNLDEGVYGLLAIWFKSSAYPYDLPAQGNMPPCGRMLRSQIDDVMGLTALASEEDFSETARVSIMVKSMVATYGYDGLSAYEVAVISGLTSLPLSKWVTNLTDVNNRIQEVEDAEVSRQSAEKQRGAAEFVRQQNEAARVEADKKRFTPKYYTEGNNTATLKAGTVTVESTGSGTTATLKGYRVEIESGLDDIVLTPGSGYKARVGSKEIATVDMIEALQARVAALEKK